MDKGIKRIFLIVLDSLGIGEMPDAALYGDAGSNTLGSIIRSKQFDAPVLTSLGLFNIDGTDNRRAVSMPKASFARLSEESKGKDTTIGHWEIAGIVSKKPLPTYPNGFPPDIIAEFERRTGRKALCNKPYSGTDVLRDYGREHLATGALIVYTSADSVFQIAAHEGMVPRAELYRYCEIAREIMSGDHAVGRIIARPFEGEYPDFKRTSGRHDFSLAPPAETMLDALKAQGLNVISVGKIYDIFAGRGLTESHPVKNNADGMETTLSLAKKDFYGLVFVNLVDFDMVYGHRNDIDGYARAVSEFDVKLEKLIGLMKKEDVLILTADHGCDPATPSTDHSREYVPLILFGEKIKQGRNLKTLSGFSHIGATVADAFCVPVDIDSSSILPEVYNG
jgi:phosphopentomutase